jgi:hypothetical protein
VSGRHRRDPFAGVPVDWIAAAAVVEREAGEDWSRLARDRRRMVREDGTVNAGCREYRALFPELRQRVGAAIVDMGHRCQEDRWVAVGEMVMARGTLTPALRALVNDAMITPALIRDHGLTEEDVRDVSWCADFDYACRHGVEITEAEWDTPADMFLTAVVGPLDALLEDAVSDLTEAQRVTESHRWTGAGPVPVGAPSAAVRRAVRDVLGSVPVSLDMVPA